MINPGTGTSTVGLKKRPDNGRSDISANEVVVVVASVDMKKSDTANRQSTENGFLDNRKSCEGNLLCL